MWRGVMSWPIVEGWKCQTCEQPGSFTWGFVNGHCRCDTCHTEYAMKNNLGNIITTPICLLRSEYIEPAKRGWLLYGIPISMWSDEQWDTVMTHHKPHEEAPR